MAPFDRFMHLFFINGKVCNVILFDAIYIFQYFYIFTGIIIDTTLSYVIHQIDLRFYVL